MGGTNLANGGEEIAVIGQDGATDIQRFVYDDRLPWPESADGPGASLVLIAPDTNPDHSLAASWRASSNPGGSPGVGDSMPFAGDPEADEDDDGINAFLEHALGTSDMASSTDSLPAAGIGSFDSGMGDEEEYLTLTFQRNLAADDVIFEVEVGGDLSTWTTDTSFVSSTNNGDGTATEVYRSNTPMRSRERELIRLRVTSR